MIYADYGEEGEMIRTKDPRKIKIITDYNTECNRLAEMEVLFIEGVIYLFLFTGYLKTEYISNYRRWLTVLSVPKQSSF